MIERAGHLERVRDLLGQFPVVGVVGARQVGKTTLAMALADRFQGEVTRFDLENPRHLHRLDDPLFALEDLRGLVVLDSRPRPARARAESSRVPGSAFPGQGRVFPTTGKYLPRPGKSLPSTGKCLP